jgi:hypothetical protein
MMNKASSLNNLSHQVDGPKYNNQERVRDIISSTQGNFDKLKKEISEKERIIEDKN